MSKLSDYPTLNWHIIFWVGYEKLQQFICEVSGGQCFKETFVTLTKIHSGKYDEKNYLKELKMAYCFFPCSMQDIQLKIKQI